ncbi:MAG TPA: DUF2232 domain-containing protein [Gemmatimonadales bacterium]|nr:DUF2232 domain-containing protein [Gemmatimonadales bacterium]
MLALAGFLLLAPPVFVFGPLAGLLLVSRPGTAREWLWLLAAGAWSALWLQQIGGVGAQVTRAAAVLLCGAFLSLTLWQPSNAVGRAVAATATAAAVLGLWMWRLGIGWSRLVQGVNQELSQYETVVREQWRTAGAPQQLIDQAGSMVHSVSQLYPGLLALAGIAGLRLAWTWYHRLAVHPMGAPPAPFRTFGFSDQLVWGWVLALTLTLVPVPEAWRLAGANLLLVLGVLYAARGLAVVLSQAGGVAGPVGVVLGFIAVFLLPFVVGGLTLLGLADTWLDFRRRLSTPSTGGFKQ